MAGVPQSTQTVIRLTNEQYDSLENKVSPNGFVSNTTTDIEAGFKLGVLHVLQILRKGFVVGA